MLTKEKILHMANYSGDLLTATISFGVDQKWQTSLTIVPKAPRRLPEELKKTIKKIEKYDFEIGYQNTKNLLALILSSKLGIVNNRNIKLFNRYNGDELKDLKESLNLILDDSYGKIYNIKKEEIDSITSAFTTMNISQINYGKFRHLNQNTEENQEQTTEEESTLDSVSMKLEEIVEELKEMLEKNNNTSKNNFIRITNDIFLIEVLNKEIKRLSVEEDKVIPFVTINNILKSLQIVTRNHIPESLSRITMPIQINVKTFIVKENESKPTLLIERNFILPKLILSKLQEALTIYNAFKEKSELIRLDYEDKSILIEHEPGKTKFTVLGKKKATVIELKDKAINSIYNSIINAITNNHGSGGAIFGTGESEEDAKLYKNTIQIYEKSEISDKPYTIYFEKYKVDMSKEELLEFAVYINNQSINQI
ncbi:MAG: hypothetical protein JHC31_15625 [Sulfurihydrogenibium sp.]|nr:hypothetical protein [Sulfurihydrogenibium sp.]